MLKSIDKVHEQGVYHKTTMWFQINVSLLYKNRILVALKDRVFYKTQSAVSLIGIDPFCYSREALYSQCVSFHI